MAITAAKIIGHFESGEGERIYVITPGYKVCPPCDSMQHGSILSLDKESCPVCGKPLFIAGITTKVQRIVLTKPEIEAVLA